MTRFCTLTVFLLAALPARAADICAAVASGSPLVPAPQTSFPADVKPFVIAADPTFQGQPMELYALGKSGAGIAIHYEGTLATEYLVAFDRVKGALQAVTVPDLNPEADEYFEAHVAMAAGTPVLFSIREADGKKITRIAPWLGHAFGSICETK
jgi:hypothetical protein